MVLGSIAIRFFRVEGWGEGDREVGRGGQGEGMLGTASPLSPPARQLRSLCFTNMASTVVQAQHNTGVGQPLYLWIKIA